MNIKRTLSTTLFVLLLPCFILPLQAQFATNISRLLQIQKIIDMDASETHLYALSETEGLVVFRAHSDSLQWLYSSAGMQDRGNKLESDIRFSYLYGDSRRLTIIEPTSVLGAYSSTTLPATPLAVARVGNSLFVAMGDEGLGRLDLSTPANADAGISEIETVSRAIDIAGDGTGSIYVLENRNALTLLDVREDAVRGNRQITLNQDIEAIFLLNDELIGSSASGDLYFINSNGNTRRIASTDGLAEKILYWNSLYFVRTENGTAWVGSDTEGFTRWKESPASGNFLAANQDNLWIAEFNSIAPLLPWDGEPGSLPESDRSERVSLRSISDVVIPFPRPVLIPIEFDSETDPSQVSLSYQAPFTNARIRGQSFYWQPASSQTGRHRVMITATSSTGESDSTSFFVDIRSFNSPPRFAPNRTVSVPVGEPFEYSVSAIDPDGPSQDLIRYMGVDLPEGATMNEQNGTLRWTPNIRQVGSHSFQVIATDQFGAASSQNFEINVIELGN